MVMPQTVTAIYENGVLTPLEKVKLRKRQKVRIKIMPAPLSKSNLKLRARRRAHTKPTRAELVRLARESFGMWAERKDIGDAVEWLDEIRAGWEERVERIYADA